MLSILAAWEPPSKRKRPFISDILARLEFQEIPTKKASQKEEMTVKISYPKT